MGRLPVEDCLCEIERLRRYSGSSIESVVSEAFKDLLKAWSRAAGLQFVPQHEVITPMRALIRICATFFLMVPKLIRPFRRDCVIR
jgi:hypothetical protein